VQEINRRQALCHADGNSQKKNSENLQYPHPLIRLRL
jgi:hypothetical protein